MPSLNFSSRFADKVEKHLKTQTIRKISKRKYKIGDTAYLFTGLRTKKVKRLGVGIIVDLQEVYINNCHIEINGIPIKQKNKNAFAKNDGFENIFDLIKWFKNTHGFPFHGILIKWRPYND